MDFGLTDEQRAIRDTARAFIAREVIPLEAELLRRQRDSGTGITRDELRELQLKAKEFGFWGPGTPESHGGMGLDAVTQALLATENGRTLVPFQFGGETDNILFYADDEQRKRYLEPAIAGELRSCFAITEPDAGSDATNISTTARRDGDDWVLRGEKTFITGGEDADLFIVIAVTDAEKRHRGGFTAFLVERGMGVTTSPIPTMGQARPASVHLDDVRVPAGNVLGEIGDGFRLAMEWIGRGRYLLPARAVGSAERLLQMALDYAKVRTTFGRPIAEHQAIQWMIADSATELEAVRYLTLLAAWQVDQGADPITSSSMAKLGAGTWANQIVDRVLQIHGGMGYTQELPVQLWARDLRLLRIYEGSDEIQRRTIARQLLNGRYRIGGHLA
ncbi:acyl-CoA dehydrogenase family protein [Allonocardiopsis opalescens]|uniref:Alkylation response protein AidB-like acyl-CoA dehydrogenase n=1 Tax=Allonocardiopsis opalescens TaxID=1144618 RepID=A0A2T0Q0T7_9ACTN|nr:acyl-CoA dehydrogenase [Allonocardiopsis opalescens]PRX97394.1 alkylation response protein AidB-like acyl-CoA dehydrogenase [Allonocardiopsis opalescens]